MRPKTDQAPRRHPFWVGDTNLLDPPGMFAFWFGFFLVGIVVSAFVLGYKAWSLPDIAIRIGIGLVCAFIAQAIYERVRRSRVPQECVDEPVL